MKFHKHFFFIFLKKSVNILSLEWFGDRVGSSIFQHERHQSITAYSTVSPDRLENGVDVLIV